MCDEPFDPSNDNGDPFDDGFEDGDGGGNSDRYYPSNDDFDRHIWLYLVKRKKMVKAFLDPAIVDPPDIMDLLDEVFDSIRLVSRLSMLNQELYDLLLQTQQLFMETGRSDDWNAALALVINSLSAKYEGHALDKAEIDESLLEEMLYILYQRSGAVHLSTGNLRQARAMLEAAINYGLDIGSTEPSKAPLWLKAYAYYLEANVSNMTLDKVEQQCRTLMELNEQQQEPSAHVKGLIYLVMAFAHRYADNWYEAFYFSQLALGIGYILDEDTLIISALPQTIEYAAMNGLKDLLDDYVWLWQYYDKLRRSQHRLNNVDLSAHFHSILGLYCFTQQKWLEAFDNYDKAARLYYVRNDTRNIGVTSHGKAMAATRMRKFEDADVLYRDAAHKYRRSGIATKEVQVMYARVRAWEENRRDAAAYRGYLVVQARLLGLPANDMRQKMLEMIERDLNNLRPRLDDD